MSFNGEQSKIHPYHEILLSKGKERNKEKEEREREIKRKIHREGERTNSWHI